MNELLRTPAADFDHPIDLLDGCHERVRRNCALAARISAQLESRGVDEEVRTAARSVLRYFGEAARNHHLDEESDLFPALILAADSDSRPAAQALVDRLKAEHVALGHLWDDMRVRLELIAEGQDATIPEELAKEFTDAYERHIVLEEAELLPLARLSLDDEALSRLGIAMAERRGVTAGWMRSSATHSRS
jgi:hemerythrin-like domain-containing protein